MKRKEYNPTVLTLLLTALLLLTGCSQDSALVEADLPDDDAPAQVEAVDISNELGTRAQYMDLTKFSISVYNTKTELLLADKLQYESDGSGGMTSSGVWRMVNNEMKCIAVSPTLTEENHVLLDADNQSFEYTVPQTEQSMLKIGGNMSFTRKSVGNKLTLKFVNALAMFNIRARNELEVVDNEDNKLPVTIYVKGFTLHNVAAKGRFNWTADYAGTWTAIDNIYYNYSQELPEKVELSTSTFKEVSDSLVVLLPQSPENNAWTPAGLDDPSEEYAAANGIAKANADHKAYIELRCSMTTIREGDTTPTYLWGTADTFVPIYFPYKGTYCPKKWNAINRQGVYNLKILKGEALDADGRPIKPQAQENGESFENAVFISVAPTDDNDEDNVDDWNDPTNDPDSQVTVTF